MTYDWCVVGGGIVGLATARALLRRTPGASLLLLEKEAAPGLHQTGHNSGVIHAGIYYPPGTLKADLCRQGALATRQFCDDHAIPYVICGKHIVATDQRELNQLDGLLQRAQRNGIAVELIDGAELRRREPHVRGLGALFSPSTGIVDYRQICCAMARDIEAAGGTIVYGAKVAGIFETANEVAIDVGEARWTSRRLVACAGLQSDRVARLAGLQVDQQIVPFRGEYFRLRHGMESIVRTLIYPVPDPAMPFLGVHLTRTIDGGVTVGPNAVLGFAREGYRKGSVNLRDLAEMARFAGLWRLARVHRRSGIREFRNSMWTRGYLELCQRYCPELTLDDLEPQEAGIRAQAVMRDGSLVQDFLWAETPRMLHVLNAPSPAATSAIPIGETIAARVAAA